MAEPQHGRTYNNGPSPSARDAAFSNIFGGPPPPGRSQTMNSQSPMPPPSRSQTMGNVQRPPPSDFSNDGYEHQKPNGYPPPGQHQRPPNGYAPQGMPNGGGGGGGGGGYGRPPPPQHPQGYHQGPPQPQQYHQQAPPERRPYVQQQRMPPPSFNRPPPNRFYPPSGPGGHPGPAMNNDPNRSRSLASYGPPPSSFHQGPGGGPSGPPHRPPPHQVVNPMARQTAQGRHIPERVDERSMSMTSPMPDPRDASRAQTMSGRVIPFRARDTSEEPYNPSASEGRGPPQFDSQFQQSSANAYRSSPALSQRSSSSTFPSRPENRDSQMSHMSSASQMSQMSQMSHNSVTSNNSSVKPRTPSYASTTSSVTPAATPTSYTPTSYTPTSQTPDSAMAPKQNQSSQSRAQTMVSQQSTILTMSRRAPLVYPALLSRVADVFRERVQIGDRMKNELTYKSAFTGAEAVDMIAYIIKTSDRNLALLLGRALDAQKFFHDVTYDHRLRDSGSEVYQFRERLVDEDKTDVNGVFTLLTECYSPTCTRDRLCYSIACPRRLEQQARLNMQPLPGLKRESSRSSLHDNDEKEQKLWIHSVPKEVAESVSDSEKKRQEVICEVIYTERDFVKDLEYLRDFWMKPLKSTVPPSPIVEFKREMFIKKVFSNMLEVHSVNSKLAEALTKRQQNNAVIHNIGDIFLEYVPHFDPFIKYGANQLYGKYEFEREKASNQAFARFVEETERMKESRKLELNGYLTKPTTRLARYPLLLEAVLKNTAEDNPDKQDLPKAIEMIRECLSKVNVESGRAENTFNLMQLDQQLQFAPADKVDLKLTEEGRQLIFKGSLKRSPTDTGTGDIQAFLFDHAILLVKIKVVNKRDQYKVYKRPIPLELLVINEMAEVLPERGIKRPPSSLLPKAGNQQKADANAKNGYSITFQHLGKRGYVLSLFAATVVGRRKWMEHIEAQQTALRERSNIFTKEVLSDDFFNFATNKVNCLVPMDGGRKLVYGTDTGIFVSDRRPGSTAQGVPKKVIDIPQVSQVDVLEEYQILLVLSEKTAYSFPIETITEPGEPAMASKRHKRIQGHVNFFKTGVCLGRVLVCCVKNSSMSATVKVYEPMDTLAKGRNKPAFRKLLAGGQDALKLFKEFYIPSEASSIHFLKSKLCVGCAKGFEVVSLETLDTQTLLDPADTSLDFVQRRENVKPIAIYRLNGGEFLLNYSDFSFFVNRNGWRARPDWSIQWEGQPTAFALQPPYILAFEPNFIEIRNMESGGMVSIIAGKNIRMLHESSREILYAYEDDGGEDVIASLDFWKQQGRA
ncbi:RHO1 GDP-GTP exchange protein 2 [Orbilia oligospora]|uniref:RHO1 GDP-GTP exchange protein 2 n=1 Tax=Orbilia oligospora TaxID=2813651 RepID=A0A7C8VIK2_ORBOL|nr:RHO1 GDP-GTP exchange protein 2 [Orbilia oligospora]